MNGNNMEKMMLIYQTLMRESDEGHKLTLRQIMEDLSKYDMSMSDKTFYNYVKLLQEYDVDVVRERGERFYYYIGERNFDFVEIKLIIDAIYSCSVLDEKRCKALSAKLLGLLSRHQASEIKKEQLPVLKRKEYNRYFYNNVDAIYRAILENRKIKFKYFSYVLGERNNVEKIHRRNGSEYVVSPYAFYWNQDNYYILVSDDRHEGIASYRIDRMDCVSVVESEKRKPLTECDLKGQSDLRGYISSMFSMYGSNEKTVVDVRLRFDEGLLDSVIDRFSTLNTFYRGKDDRIECRVNVAISPTFYSWIFQFGKRMEIIYPRFVIEQYVGYLRENIDIYANNFEKIK